MAGDLRERLKRVADREALPDALVPEEAEALAEAAPEMTWRELAEIVTLLREADAALASAEQAQARLEQEVHQWRTKRNHGGCQEDLLAEVGRRVEAEKRAEQAKRERDEARAEAEDWHLAADGIKHHFECRNNAVTGNPTYGIECDRCRAEQAERACATLREALEQIAGMGVVFDAKGTHSERVANIARAALARVPAAEGQE